MRIALVVDNPYRDLPGLVLLGMRLSRAGARCYLVPLNLASLELSALAPDAVLLTSLRKPRQWFAAQLLEAGIQIAVLDAEGGVLPSLEMYSKLTTPDRHLYREVSCFCSWGPKLATYVKSEEWYSDDQVVVTGAPRFDFYSSMWRDAALRFSPEIDRYQKPIILINGSFPRANPLILTPEKELESWMALGFERDYVTRQQQTEQQTLRQMAKLANHIATRFPDASIVYRPHPFEKPDTYRQLLKPLPNLHLVKSGTIEAWIFNASAVVQHHCTTAIEAGMAGVPALLPDWLPTAQRIESTESVSIKSSSESELDAQLSEIIRGSNGVANGIQPSLNRVLSEWFYAIDGMAHERVASALLNKFKTTYGSVNLSKCRKIHYDWGKPGRPMRTRIGSAARMSLSLPVSWSVRKMGDVKDWHKRWDASAKQFDSSSVRRLVHAIEPGSSTNVEPAEQKVDYRIGYTVGRSVVLSR